MKQIALVLFIGFALSLCNLSEKLHHVRGLEILPLFGGHPRQWPPCQGSRLLTKYGAELVSGMSYCKLPNDVLETLFLYSKDDSSIYDALGSLDSRAQSGASSENGRHLRSPDGIGCG